MPPAQDVHPLDHAQELGAHCSGTELAAFIRRYFSVMQVGMRPRCIYAKCLQTISEGVTKAAADQRAAGGAGTAAWSIIIDIVST